MTTLAGHKAPKCTRASKAAAAMRIAHATMEGEYGPRSPAHAKPYRWLVEAT